MSQYPAAVAGQGLYEVSDTPKAKLGTEMSFWTPNGVVSARYMQMVNGTSTLAAGHGVGHVPGSYIMNTAVLNNASAPMMCFAGIAVGNYTTTGQYGWVVYRGPVTNVFLAVSLPSSAGARYLSLNSLGQYSGFTLSTLATDNWVAGLRVHAVMASGTATYTTAGGTGLVAHIFWR